MQIHKLFRSERCQTGHLLWLFFPFLCVKRLPWVLSAGHWTVTNRESTAGTFAPARLITIMAVQCNVLLGKSLGPGIHVVILWHTPPIYCERRGSAHPQSNSTSWWRGPCPAGQHKLPHLYISTPAAMQRAKLPKSQSDCGSIGRSAARLIYGGSALLPLIRRNLKDLRADRYLRFQYCA